MLTNMFNWTRARPFAQQQTMRVHVPTGSRKSNPEGQGVKAGGTRHIFKLGLTSMLCAAIATAQAARPSSQQTQPAADAAIIEALRGGQNEEALQLSRRVLLNHPGDCKVLSLQAMAHSGLGQAEAALGSFKTALAHCPSYLPALEGAAQLEYALKDAGVEPTLARILTLQPGNETAHAMLATRLLSRNCSEALPHFAASEGMFPARPDLQQGYAFCLAQTGATTEALAQYGQLAAAHPSDEITYDIALLQFKTKAAPAALATLQPLLSEGRFEPAFSLASKIAEEGGDTPRAVSLLRTAIALNPDDLDNYLVFSRLAYDHSSFPVGVAMLSAGLQRLPKAASLYLARGVLEVQMSETDAAISDFEKAHQLDAKLSFAEDAMGLMLTQQHQNAAALARFQAEVKEHPEDAFLQYLLAEQLSESPEEAGGATLAAAIAAAKASTALAPGYQPAQDLLILLYMRARQPALAIEQAERVLAQNPNDESALYQELLARRRLGQTQSLDALTARLVAARKENAAKQESVSHYRLLGANER